MSETRATETARPPDPRELGAQVGRDLKGDGAHSARAALQRLVAGGLKLDTLACQSWCLALASLGGSGADFNVVLALAGHFGTAAAPALLAGPGRPEVLRELLRPKALGGGALVGAPGAAVTCMRGADGRWQLSGEAHGVWNLDQGDAWLLPVSLEAGPALAAVRRGEAKLRPAGVLSLEGVALDAHRLWGPLDAPTAARLSAAGWCCFAAAQLGTLLALHRAAFDAARSTTPQAPTPDAGAAGRQLLGTLQISFEVARLLLDRAAAAVDAGLAEAPVFAAEAALQTGGLADQLVALEAEQSTGGAHRGVYPLLQAFTLLAPGRRVLRAAVASPWLKPQT
ncbi:MAG: hypothetical protein IPJ65_35075 [Archangiaceae bacterium]|nr:hypothetical protein [Archangiaceae bacterium]